MSHRATTPSRVVLPDSQWAPFGRTVALLTVAGMLVVGQMYTVLPMFAPMAATFGAAPGQMTWLVSSFGFAYAIGFLLMGPLSDRYGSRAVILFGLIATSTTTALVALSPNLATAAGLRAVQGLAGASFAPAAFSYLAEHLAPARRPVALACLTSGYLAAAVAMQAGAQLVATAWGWQAVFLVCAPGFLAIAAAARVVLRPSRHGHTVGVLAALATMPRLAVRPRLRTLYLATMSILGGFVAVYTAIALAGPSGLTGDPDALLALRASALPAVVVVPLITPMLARMVGPNARAALGLGIAAVATLCAGLFGSDAVTLGAILLVFVAGIAVAAPGLVEAIGGAAAESRGSAVALYAFAMFVGASLGPQVVTALTAWGFGVILQVVALILALGGLLALASRSRDMGTISGIRD
jgi:MFS family permease